VALEAAGSGKGFKEKGWRGTVKWLVGAVGLLHWRDKSGPGPVTP